MVRPVAQAPMEKVSRMTGGPSPKAECVKKAIMLRMRSRFSLERRPVVRLAGGSRRIRRGWCP